MSEWLCSRLVYSGVMNAGCMADFLVVVAVVAFAVVMLGLIWALERV
jgi:hypothetical protein